MHEIGYIAGCLVAHAVNTLNWSSFYVREIYAEQVGSRVYLAVTNKAGKIRTISTPDNEIP